MTEEEKLITALKAAGLEPGINANVYSFPPLDKCFMRGFGYTMGGVTAIAVVSLISKLLEWIL